MRRRGGNRLVQVNTVNAFQAAVEWRDPRALAPYGHNAKTHPPEQIAKIAASIAVFGFDQPIVVDGAGVIIKGHARREASLRLGLNRVPVVVRTDLSPAEIQAARIADNKTAESPWDEQLLRVELAALEDDGFDLALTGFSDEELEALLAEPEETHQGLTDEDAIPQEPERPITQPGDLWILGEHRLLCGDATAPADVQQLLNGVSPVLMVTDPPWGVEYDPGWRAQAGVNRNRSKLGKVQNDDRADWREAWSLFPGDVAYVWHAGRFAALVQESLEACGFTIRSQIIWAKDRFALSRGDYHWQHEPCWYAVRSESHWNGDRSQSTVWRIAAREDGGHGHGTQKPVECMRRPMLNNSKPGGVVYDPFLGSGTSLIAAETTGRICYGLEINPAYCDLILRRWQEFTGKVAILASDGRSFPQVGEVRGWESAD
jgi:DNA modification methylase